MYSPKVAEDLVPVLYRLARDQRVPMTRLVNGIIRQALAANSLPERPEDFDRAEVSSAAVEPRPAVT
jgi:hypothetical protein